MWARLLAAAALLLLVTVPDARTKRSKRAKRHSSGGDDGDDGSGYDASDCNGPWDTSSAEDEALLGLTDNRCDFEEVSAADFSPSTFAEWFALRRPLIVRNSSANERAREFLSQRCDVLRKYGSVPVDLGDPFSLAKHGRPSRRMSLGDYLDTPFEADAPLYFFDRDGRWSESMGEFRELLSPPSSASVSLSPPPEPGEPERPMIFAIGKTGSGIGLHQHQDAWNQLLLGRKRWTVYPGDPGGVPPAASYNPSRPHLRWLRDVYPSLPADARPLECVQRPGDVVYVPSGWYHATVNIGDTAVRCMDCHYHHYHHHHHHHHYHHYHHYYHHYIYNIICINYHLYIMQLTLHG
jgi:hypothetical protein